MAGGKMEADLLLNARQFVAEAKKAELSLEDIVKEYDDLADESGRTERDVVADLKKISRQAKDTGDDIKHSTAGGFKDAGDDIRGFKDEAKQNFAEVASSFDGSIDDMVGGVQGLTGGLASALTPGIGIPIAVIGAVAATFLAEWQKNTEAAEQRVSDMYDDMIESGKNFASQDFIQKQVQDIIGDPARLKEAQGIVATTGATIQDVLRAMAGEQSSINTVIDQANSKRDTELGKLQALADGSGANADAQDAVNLKIDDSISKLTGVESATQKAVEQAALYRSTVDTANDELDAQAAKVKAVEDAARRLAQSPYTLKIDADASEFERKIGLLQGRKVVLDVSGNIDRIGNQVK